MTEKLQKLMAKGGLGSRRHCEKLIADGRVRVNGEVARLGRRADPQHDRIEVDGRILAIEEPQYIMLHKPRGVISSTEDELRQGRPTVRELVSLPGHLYPVGRLDRQSEGLMLLTNDGHLAHRLTHPRFGHEKVYHVEVEGKVPDEKLSRWRKGVMLDGKRTAPAEIVIIRLGGHNSVLRVTLREGRKRQIRRIAADLGHPVVRLVRKRIGSVEIGDLAEGQWRHLTAQEVHALRESVSGSDIQDREERFDI
jgi:pseudouridine synthase